MPDPNVPADADLTADQVQEALLKAFPDISPDLAKKAAAAIVAKAHQQSSQVGAADAFKYYVANATHTRALGINSSFLGQLPLVRFPLPATGNFDTDPVPTLHTAIGDVTPGDRKIASVA